MKKLFFSLVALVVATMSYAQSSVLATLSHEGEISTFYGAGALKSAHAAAEHGDVITLSSGSFQATDITKAVTIRGAGMQMDTQTKTFPTIISGDFSINIPDDIEQRLTLEGIYNDFEIKVSGTLKNATFLKCRFHLVLPWTSTDRMKNLTFIHCKINSGFRLPAESSASFVGCYILDPYCITKTSSYYEFTNCVINAKGGLYRVYASSTSSEYMSLSSIKNSSFINCIIYANYDFTTGSHVTQNLIDSSCTAYYCVGKNNVSESVFKNIPNTTNTVIFELTDEAVTKYIGSDGKQVGIYGGDLPYNPRPTNPQITKCNVASKSTADGKLSVDIEVSAVE